MRTVRSHTGFLKGGREFVRVEVSIPIQVKLIVEDAP